MAKDAAIVRRVADRGTDVAAGLDPGQACGQRRRRAAGRAAWCARKVPGVVGGAVDLVVALPVGEHERHVGLAKQDDTGVEHALHRQGILAGDIGLEIR